MNIALLYDKKDTDMEDKIQRMKEQTAHSKEIKNYDFRYITRITSKSECDIFLILTDEEAVLKTFEGKIKDKNRIVIVTGNLSTSYVLTCIDITKHLCYKNSTPEMILHKIIEVYEENKYAM